MDNDPRAANAGDSVAVNTSTNIEIRAGNDEVHGEPLHGPRLWLLLAGLFLGVFLVALDLTMLSIIVPTLTDEFDSLEDVSWYESAYVLSLCVFIPSSAQMYDILPKKLVYLSFMAIFEAGSLICALSRSSPVFIGGRVISGIASAGLLSGVLLIIGSVCHPKSRPIATTSAMSMMPIGSITGPIIAGVLTAQMTWRWCFWMLMPIGGFTMFVSLAIRIPERKGQLSLCQALRTWTRTLDPVGFLIFTAATATLLLGIIWGGASLSWSSPTVIGLLCGSGGLTIVFGIWARHKGDKALIPPSCFTNRSVYMGSLLMFLQGGMSQMIPYYLPFWFQAVRGDGPTDSAVHMLPSLVTNVLTLVLFGGLVRKWEYIPPWAIMGSLLTCVGSGLLTTLKPGTSAGMWIGYQIITTAGLGISFQVPNIAVQEQVSAAHNAISLATVNVFMQLGISIAVSAGQSILNNQLPALLKQYAPDVDLTLVLDTGAIRVRDFIPAAQLPDFLMAYNLAMTRMFYFSTAAAALSCLASFGLVWTKMGDGEDAVREESVVKEVASEEKPISQGQKDA